MTPRITYIKMITEIAMYTTKETCDSLTQHVASSRELQKELLIRFNS